MHEHKDSILTQYSKIVFRSTLEAKWAIFFDYLKIRWSYEPESFNLEDGSIYTPDFYLEDFGWIEVKPSIQELLKKLPKYKAFKDQCCAKSNDSFFSFCSSTISDRSPNSIIEFEGSTQYIGGFIFGYCEHCQRYIFEIRHDDLYYSRFCDHFRYSVNQSSKFHEIEKAFRTANNARCLDSVGNFNRIIIPV